MFHAEEKQAQQRSSMAGAHEIEQIGSIKDLGADPQNVCNLSMRKHVTG